jgi:hemolysin activation/secretion protein
LGLALAAPTPGDLDLIRERQDRLLDKQRLRLDALKKLPGKVVKPAEPTAPADTRCFPIKDIELEGADSLAPEEKERLLKPYIGQCLGVTQLNDVLKVITDHYIDSGLMASRGYLPQQDWSGGHLKVLVVEGRLEGLKRAPDSRLTARELEMAFPGQVGDLLNLQDIEQLVDQLNRLPSNQAQMELTPGQSVGGSDVWVKNAAKAPWCASPSRNNDGQKSTRDQQWEVGFEWDSPLGMADQLILRSGHDAISDHRKTSKSTSLSYSLPWGWWTLNFSYSQSKYGSVVLGDGFGFKQSGDSRNHGQCPRIGCARCLLSTAPASAMTRAVIRNDRYNGETHGRVSARSIRNAP